MRRPAALEVVHRRQRLVRALRDRDVPAIDVGAPGLAGALVNRHLRVKDWNLI
jgi:hypothetical protein